jgi:DNA-binding response OmpR family regulator
MSRKRLLIVDNDERVLIELERILEEQGYETATAWEIPRDIKTLASSRFDLLLIGDHPPDINCERVLKLLASCPNEMPVVVLQSAARHPFSEAYLRRLGAARVVCKWNRAEVKEAVASTTCGGVNRAAA